MPPPRAGASAGRYWFTSNSVTVYHAVTVVNSVINAWLMPLAYLALRRVHLRRPVTDTAP